MWTAWCVAMFFFGASKESVEPRYLLCCEENVVYLVSSDFVLLCLIGAEITQTPSLVLKEDERAILTCSQNANHNYMCWYLQQPGKGLQLIYYSFGTNDQQEGDIPTGYTAKRFNISDFHLDILSAKMNYSAVYFCASSENTTLQSHLLSLHKLALLSSTFLQKGAVPLAAQEKGTWANSLVTNQVLPRSCNKRCNRSLNGRLIAKLLFPDQLFVSYPIRTINKDF